MLDQLVAFCGERIALDDVLGIFGFTAPETVARLAGHCSNARHSETLAVLDEQSEGGKDLLRLLSRTDRPSAQPARFPGQPDERADRNPAASGGRVPGAVRR